MKLGVATVVTDEGIRPDVLAKALEERAFDSLVVAEHSHIPTSRTTPFPAGGELPREYHRSYDPFVALTAAALATSKLLIGPGVLLLPQRDTIETAKAVASLDQVSGGDCCSVWAWAGTSRRPPITALKPHCEAHCSTRSSPP